MELPALFEHPQEQPLRSSGPLKQKSDRFFRNDFGIDCEL